MVAAALDRLEEQPPRPSRRSVFNSSWLPRALRIRVGAVIPLRDDGEDDTKYDSRDA